MVKLKRIHLVQKSVKASHFSFYFQMKIRHHQQKSQTSQQKLFMYCFSLIFCNLIVKFLKYNLCLNLRLLCSYMSIFGHFLKCMIIKMAIFKKLKTLTLNLLREVGVHCIQLKTKNNVICLLYGCKSGTPVCAPLSQSPL